MNLFVLGCAATGSVDPGSARAALARVIARAPSLDPAGIESWTAASGGAVAAWAAHHPDRIGGVRYVRCEPDRLALFAGRPVRWSEDGRADGRGPLDLESLLAGASSWARGIDGRFAAARYDAPDHVLEVVTDPLGAYPVFCAQARGARWISNSADALRLIAGTAEIDPLALAGLLGGGWPLDGHPLWSGVRRLERGRVHRFERGVPAASEELLPAERIAAMPGAGFDAEAAAAVLVASVRALGDWPGRPSVVPVTGGRDSRLVLAAAVAAGLDTGANTGGAPDAPDVRIGRLLAQRAGVDHEMIPADPAGDMYSATARAAEVLAATTAGTASLADAAGFPLSGGQGPLPLWHTGQGGEIARSYYGAPRPATRDGVIEALLRAFLGRRAGRAEVISAEAVALIRERVTAFVDDQVRAGAGLADVPDLFYLLRRMSTWAAPTHGCVEWIRDSTSPLWSARLLPHLLGLPAAERAREMFHLRVLEVLAPGLVDLPFEGDRRWPAREYGAARRIRRARVLAAKAVAEARRRAPLHGRDAPAPSPGEAGASVPPQDPLVVIRDAVLGQPGHPAWGVLDRARVEALLARVPGGLDTMSRYYVWRLGTVFLPEAYAGATLAVPHP